MHDLTPIVFFDGWCGLCDRFISFVAARDRRRALRFAPLQGVTARAVLGAPLRDSTRPHSVVLVDALGTHERSTAILRALMALGGPWRAVALLLVVPRRVRDATYDWVARHRYHWFGRRESCRLPGPTEREQFLP